MAKLWEKRNQRIFSDRLTQCAHNDGLSLSLFFSFAGISTLFAAVLLGVSPQFGAFATNELNRANLFKGLDSRCSLCAARLFRSISDGGKTYTNKMATAYIRWIPNDHHWNIVYVVLWRSNAANALDIMHALPLKSVAGQSADWNFK